MKNTIFALFSICLILLTGCVFASDEDEQRTVKPTQIVETVKTEKVAELQNSAKPVTEPMRLSQADIDSVCEGLFAS